LRLTFIGASNSSRMGWPMKISRDLVHRYRISNSSSFTVWPGLLPRTSLSLCMMASKSTSFSAIAGTCYWRRCRGAVGSKGEACAGQRAGSKNFARAVVLLWLWRGAIVLAQTLERWSVVASQQFQFAVTQLGPPRGRSRGGDSPP
jgi:hypothetical protein